MANIKDVCKLAGVSKATVSRVINQTGQVKESTRNSVLAAMEELGYQPNTLAQALATNTSNAIGLLLPNFRSNYFGSVLHCAELGAQQAQKKLLVVNSKNSADGEREALDTLVNQRCDAIIVYSRHLTQQALVALQERYEVPLIILNRLLDSEQLHSFGLDQQQLADTAVEHLCQLGHQRIACITSPMESETGQIRFQSYQKTLEKYGLPYQPHWVAEGENTLETGYEAAKQLIAAGVEFSALFACNDDMAIGAIRALHDHGLNVPKDVSVIGIDNEPAAAYAIPSLSSVSLPIEQLTDDAVRLAIHVGNKCSSEPVHYRYVGSLVARESTQPYRES